jgi:Flp pilus assembly pilin Flp
MLHYMLTWARAMRREEGQDLAEYALLIALIAVAAVAVVSVMSFELNEALRRVAEEISRHPGMQP